MSRSLVALAICLSMGSAAQSQQPRTKWQVNIAPAQCTLSGIVDHPTVSGMSISTVPGSGSYVVTLTGDALHRRSNSHQAAVRIGFDSASERMSGFATYLRQKEGGRAIRITGLPADFAERFERTPAIMIESDKETVGPVVLSGTAKAIAAFKACIAEQLVEWGANPEQFKPGGTPAAAKAHPDSWLTPAQLMKQPFTGDSVDLVLKLSITPEGVVDGCEQVAGLTNAPASKAVCGRLLTRPLFTPARDSAGAPIRGAGAHRIQLFRRQTIG